MLSVAIMIKACPKHLAKVRVLLSGGAKHFKNKEFICSLDLLALLGQAKSG